MYEFNALVAAEKELPQFLRSETRWSTRLIDYAPPTVERIWTQWGEHRIFLHCIHPCQKGSAFNHPHPWPSAVHVYSGSGTYRMGVGYDPIAAIAHHGGVEHIPPERAMTIETKGDFRYEMTNPATWHFVEPIDAPVYSVMVTGRRWHEETAPREKEVFGPLSNERFEELMFIFKALVARDQARDPNEKGSDRFKRIREQVGCGLGLAKMIIHGRCGDDFVERVLERRKHDALLHSKNTT